MNGLLLILELGLVLSGNLTMAIGLPLLLIAIGIMAG
jgi:hypothetical protein